MGLQLYEAGAAPKLLMSGDHGSVGYDEVNAMKDYATDRGVPSEDVFQDHAGFSTYESMYRARDVFAAQRIIIVSQRYHLYRASTTPGPWAWTPGAWPPRTSPIPANFSGKFGRFCAGTRTFSTVYFSLCPPIWAR